MAPTQEPVAGKGRGPEAERLAAAPAAAPTRSAPAAPAFGVPVTHGPSPATDAMAAERAGAASDVAPIDRLRAVSRRGPVAPVPAYAGLRRMTEGDSASSAPPSPDTVESLLAGALGAANGAMTHCQELIEGSQHLHRDSGIKLFQASVLLQLRTDGVLALIERDGVERVAAEFARVFGRPVIEGAALAWFHDENPGRVGFFREWAHTLWATIVGNDLLTSDQVQEVFCHDKGYNRAIKFAQKEAMLANGLMPLDSLLAEEISRAGDGADGIGIAIMNALFTAKLLTAALPWGVWTDLLAEHDDDLKTGLGDRYAQYEQLLGGGGLQAQLSALSLVEDEDEDEAPAAADVPANA